MAATHPSVLSSWLRHGCRSASFTFMDITQPSNHSAPLWDMETVVTAQDTVNLELNTLQWDCSPNALYIRSPCPHILEPTVRQYLCHVTILLPLFKDCHDAVLRTIPWQLFRDYHDAVLRTILLLLLRDYHDVVPRTILLLPSVITMMLCRGPFHNHSSAIIIMVFWGPFCYHSSVITMRPFHQGRRS